MSKHSEACCKIPPIIDENYTPNGKYIDLNGTKTYVTGFPDATKAILSIYDIFGLRSQIIQGADILAEGDTEQKFQVFMPDFFDGNPADISWYPPDSEEKEQALGKWFETASPPKHLPKVAGLLEAAQKVNPNIQSWGCIGYCWVAKMVSLIAGRDGTPFKAGVQTSPALIENVDAEKVKIPMMMLASMDEPRDDVEGYDKGLKVTKHIETFSDQLHGWMSARADLKDAKCKSEYERGYKLASGWFHDYV